MFLVALAALYLSLVADYALNASLDFWMTSTVFHKINSPPPPPALGENLSVGGNLNFSPSTGTRLTCPVKKKALDLSYIYHGGEHEGMPLIYFWRKVDFVKHSNDHPDHHDHPEADLNQKKC